MSDEIEYLEEEQENHVANSNEKMSTNSGAKRVAGIVATATVIIGVQLVGALLAVVIGFAYFITMEVIGGDDYFSLILGIMAGISLLIINAWIFYFRGHKAAALIWSFGIYSLLPLYFMGSEVVNFTVVVLFLLTVYVIVRRDFAKESDFLKIDAKLLGILLPLVVLGFIFFFSPISSSSSRSSAPAYSSGSSAASGPSATPRSSATPVPTKFRPTDIPATAAPTLMPPSNLAVGSTWLQTKDGMTLAYIPAGEFKMGGSVPKMGGAEPAHDVYLDAYWIDQTEVTNAMYARCVSDGACDYPESISIQNYSDYYVNTKYDEYPVANMSWEDANTYCSWAGRRLLTEAEWEKAARGGLEKQPYSWGTEEPDCGNKNVENGVNCYGTEMMGTPLEKVGSYFPNGYGVYDMSSNLFEWVADWYSEDFYANSPFENPTGPDTGTKKVVRGGSWFGLHIATRLDMWPTQFNNGFRCARSATETFTITPAEIPEATPATNSRVVSTEMPASQPGDLVYNTTFGDFDDWLTYLDKDLSEYTIESRSDGLYVKLPKEGYYLQGFYNKIDEENVKIATDIEFTGGSSNDVIVELYCRTSADGYYQFYINPTGFWGIFKVDLNAEDPYTTLAGVEYSNEINSGYDSNQIEVTCNDNELSLAVNGHLLRTLQDEQFSKGGVGFGFQSFDAPLADPEIMLRRFEVYIP